MPSSRPTIGVTGPERGGLAAWLFTAASVWFEGGRAVRITPSRPPSFDRLDGLVLGGGADLDPALYGEKPQDMVKELRGREGSSISYLVGLVFYPFLYLVRRVFSATSIGRKDPARDELEHGLIDLALKKGIPILGICRGAQLLNVFFGGSLYQDLSDFYVEVPQVHTILPRKRIHIEPASRLSAILGTNTCKVNALHHQAIKRLGNDIIVAAREPNYVVQGIEHKVLPFVLGIQWHPEYLFQQSSQRSIFRSLIRASSDGSVLAGC